MRLIDSVTKQVRALHYTGRKVRARARVDNREHRTNHRLGRMGWRVACICLHCQCESGTTSAAVVVHVRLKRTYGGAPPARTHARTRAALRYVGGACVLQHIVLIRTRADPGDEKCTWRVSVCVSNILRGLRGFDHQPPPPPVSQSDTHTHPQKGVTPTHRVLVLMCMRYAGPLLRCDR